MTFDEWRSRNPCEQKFSAGGCWNCTCSYGAWKQQDANRAPLVEACRCLAEADELKRETDFITAVADIRALVKAVNDG